MDKILTFDCYGTLFDTKPLYDYIGSIASANNISPEKAKAVFINYEDRLMYGENYIPYDMLLEGILEYCDMQFSTDSFCRELENVIQIHADFSPFFDVLETFSFLKAKGYSIYIMSNTNHMIMDNHIKKLEGLPDGVILSEDTHCYKPQLDFFKKTYDILDLGNRDHCHIAKGFWRDIVPCSKLNWNKIWVNRDGIRGNERYKPYQEILSLNELTKIL